MPRPGANVYPLNLTQARPKIAPINPLSKNERKVFDVTWREHRHLKPADVLMLEAFSISVRRVAVAKRKGAQQWERESRVMMAYGTKLRLTPQSTTEAKTAARRRAEQGESYYDRMSKEENE